jgi:UDP-glucuronate decarboxylase
MMASSTETTGPFNLGNPVEFSIKQLAEEVISKVGGKSKIIYKDLPQDDPKQRRPDITLVKENLGWEPKVNLDSGLVKTIDYFRTFLNQ